MLSVFVGIISKDGYPYRNKFHEVIAECPLVDQTAVTGMDFRLDDGGYATISHLEDEQELAIFFKDGHSEERLLRFKEFFDWLCEHTTWDLLLDWEDTQDEQTGEYREEIYRPSQAKAA